MVYIRVVGSQRRAVHVGKRVSPARVRLEVGAVDQTRKGAPRNIDLHLLGVRGAFGELDRLSLSLSLTGLVAVRVGTTTAAGLKHHFLDD